MLQKNFYKRDTGIKGEDAAVKYLIEKGYKILKRNFRVGRLGEIDIIAKDLEYICFIEVKTRSSYSFGSPAESVNRAKQEKITKLAYIYIQNNNLSESNIRFDIMELILENKSGKTDVKEVNLIKNAF